MIALLLAMWGDLRYQGMKTREKLDDHVEDAEAHNYVKGRSHAR